MIKILISILLEFSNARENTIISESGQEMVCTISGPSVAVLAPAYSAYNQIPEASFVWTSSGAIDNDHCSIKVQFLRHSWHSSIILDISSMDTEYLLVNGEKCLKEWNSAINATSCFGAPGYYDLMIESRHTAGSYGMAFRLVETYDCSEECSSAWKTFAVPQIT